MNDNNQLIVKRSHQEFDLNDYKEEIESEEFNESDINEYICSKSETDNKEKEWVEENKDWLEDQKNKELIKEQKNLISKQRVPKKPKLEIKMESTRSNNSIVNNILNVCKIQKKIDTSALEKLFKEAESHASKSIHNKSFND